MTRKLLVAAAAPLLVAAAVSSSPSGAGSAAFSHARLHRAGGVFALERSTNWSGDAVTGGSYSRVTGSWVVPTVTVSTSNGYAADWVGIGGYGTGDLIQAGTAEQSVHRHATYYAWTEILPASESRIALTVRPGDSITVDVNQVSSNSWTITLTDHSTGRSASRNLAYVSTHSSAEWIHEAPTIGGRQARLAATTNANFDLGTVNGGTVIGSAGTLHEIQLTGPLPATPSALDSDRDGLAVADGTAVPPPPPS